MEVKCPRCGNPAVFAQTNPFRPFCSERCKLIDLGAWAEGKYAIPVSTPLPDKDNENEHADGDESDGTKH